MEDFSSSFWLFYLFFTHTITMSSALLKKLAPRKRRSKANGSSSVVPLQSTVTTRYASKHTMNPGSGGAAAAYFYSANGLFDPDRSLGGHQPYGFDEYMELYDHFVVLRSRIMVTFMTYGSTNTQSDNVICAVGLRDTTTSTTDMMLKIEMGRGEWSVVGNSAGGNSSATLTMSCDVGAYLGRRDVLSDPDLKGSSTADPTEECFYEINVASLDGADPPPLDALVVIEYDVAYIEPRRLIGS